MPNLGFSALIRNVTTHMACLDRCASPVGNSYVVLPLTTYGAYVDFEQLSMGRPCEA